MSRLELNSSVKQPFSGESLQENQKINQAGFILDFRATTSTKPSIQPILQGQMYPRRPRGSQSCREKGHDESFQVRAKEPLGTDPHRVISKNSRGCWLLIGHKKCFVLLCPIGEQFLLSSFREFIHDGYCLATLPRFLHQACACKENFYFPLS